MRRESLIHGRRAFLRQLLYKIPVEYYCLLDNAKNIIPFASFATDRTLLPSLEDSPLFDFEAVSFFFSASFGLSFEVLSLLSPFTSLSSLPSFFASAVASAVSVLGLLRFAPLKDLIIYRRSTKIGKPIIQFLVVASMFTFDRAENHLHPPNRCTRCLAQFFCPRLVLISVHLDSIYPLRQNHR